MTDNPRKPDPAAKPSAESYIPAHVRREVWKRDKGQCQWPVQSGGICGSTSRVEFDHRIATALGGRSTVANLRLLCRFHNDLAARAVFGDEKMDQFKRKGGDVSPPEPVAGADPPVPSDAGAASVTRSRPDGGGG